MAYLANIRETVFWEAIDLTQLEDLRLRMRGLMAFIDKNKRTIVYTDFKDEIIGVREEEVIDIPTMTGQQYAKKVEDYLRDHLDHIVIHRLRSNQPLTPTDLQELETKLVEIGEDDGEQLLSGLLTRTEAP